MPLRFTLGLAWMGLVACVTPGTNAPLKDEAPREDDSAGTHDSGEQADSDSGNESDSGSENGRDDDSANESIQVDASTLIGKHLLGYQGWFGCPGDDSQVDNWSHWSPGVSPTPDSVSFDAWPDMTELPEGERCVTDMTLPDGSPAALFSSHHPDTVARHFQWMEDHKLDGVLLQRFSSEFFSPPHLAFRDTVAQHVRNSAEETGRVYAIMYDISGHNGSTLVSDLQADWRHLVDTLALTDSSSYLSHNGRPLVGVWGLGFSDREGTPAQAHAILDFFQDNPEEKYRATVVGGVPTWWRSLTGDSKTDPAWTSYYQRLDVISPWAVGRYGDNAGADTFRQDLIEPDLVAAAGFGADYMPVIFPGFSWANLRNDPSLFNQIPRNGGEFYWRQVYNTAQSGATMLYTAMFDEVDEGTAMFKLAPGVNSRPVEGTFLTLDADGHTLPSDWYLSLAEAATEVFHRDRVPTESIPITP